MDLEHVRKNVVKYREKFNRLWPRLPALRCDDIAHAQHLLFMCNEIEQMILDKKPEDKIFRWYGFLQGVMCVLGYYMLSDMKDDNRTADHGKRCDNLG